MKNVLAADVGGTTTRLGVFETGAPRPRPIAVRTYGTTEFGGFPEVVAAFLRDAAIDARSIGHACFGVAGPVLDGRATLTNTPIEVNAAAIGKATGIGRVSLLNDLEALACAVPALADDEVRVLQRGRPVAGGAIAVIAAGTGLGEAVLYDIEGRLVAKATEAGRSDFAARTDRDIVVLRELTRTYGRAAVEHVVAGVGLVHIHKALHRSCRAGIDFGSADAPAKISAAALARACPGCIDALDVFVEAYGAEAGNLALRTVATGGVYVGGGIAPKILDALAGGSFLAAFRSKAPFTSLLEAMPVKVILNADAGLFGAAIFCSRA
ncbi:MAG TPA: glucokinase [Vicinamibacterales bacterium]|nr:glucokinase [Vicinamibacterales bacterium]